MPWHATKFGLLPEVDGSVGQGGILTFELLLVAAELLLDAIAVLILDLERFPGLALMPGVVRSFSVMQPDGQSAPFPAPRDSSLSPGFA